MISAMPSKRTLGTTLALLAVALIAPTVAVRVQDKAADWAASQAADTAG